MDLGLKDRVVLVTGASRGLGRAIASSLASEGARLAICARGEKALRQAAAEMESQGAEVVAVPCDVTSEADQEAMVARISARFGAIDVVVSNVGGNHGGRIWETSDDDWKRIVDLNLLSHVRLMRRLIPSMRERHRGVILFVASIYGREAGGPGLGIYNSTKSALISLAKILSLELAGDGIRVNSIAPGPILYPGGSWQRRREQDPEGMKNYVAQNIPLGRFGQPEEVGDIVAFLASERASWVTGSCWTVDGGHSRTLF